MAKPAGARAFMLESMKIQLMAEKKARKGENTDTFIDEEGGE